MKRAMKDQRRSCEKEGESQKVFSSNMVFENWRIISHLRTWRFVFHV